MQFRTFSQLSNVINKNLHLISDEYDLIIGIPRSGMLPATMISLLKNIPLVDLMTFQRGEIYEPGVTKVNAGWIKTISEAKRVLVVEDSCTSGNSISKAKDIIGKLKNDIKYDYLAIYVTAESQKFVDIYFERIEHPREFEWNYLHHSLLEKACFDIDGVLCIDPSNEQNDDGEKYLDFIRNVPARIIPTKKIGYLVTSRLEKYRSETDAWLKRNEILYGTMYMMQYSTKEERIRAGNHGEYKGQIYKKLSDTILFVESDPSQAEIINEISKKAVFCTGNQRYYPEKGLNKLNETINQSIHGKLLNKIRYSRLYRFLKKIKNWIK